MDKIDDTFWEDLIASIDDGHVIPVIGQGVITFGEDDRAFYPWLAQQVAMEPGMNSDAIPESPSLNDVAVAHLTTQPKSNEPYTATSRVIKREKPTPGPLLKQLASIQKFDLFISTSVDTLLEEALNEVRHASQAKMENLLKCFPEDLPVRKEELSGPFVYKLMGRVTGARNWALWEGDLLERLLDLNMHLQQVNNLSKDLEKHGLLLIGLGFSDWVTRLFVRFVQGQPGRPPPIIPLLADAAPLVQPSIANANGKSSHTIKSQSPASSAQEPLVMFFRASTQSIRVIRHCPMEFVRELVGKWQETHGDQAKSSPSVRPIPREMKRGAIFISYAREDEVAARRVVATLQAAGCDVWYDRERLKPGQYWPDELEDEVTTRCGLFLSLISNTTEREPEGYFHQERNWAVDRHGRISRGIDRTGTEFYLPVVIEGNSLSPKREPKKLKIIQAFSAPEGYLPAPVVEHVKALQDEYLGYSC